MRVPSDSTEVLHAIRDGTQVCGAPQVDVASALHGVKVGAPLDLRSIGEFVQRPLLGRVQWLFGEVLIPVRVEFQKLGVDFLDSPLEDDSLAAGCYLNTPLGDDDGTTLERT